MKIHFSSKSNEWYTPQDFYDDLDKVFNFQLDVCATDDNHKCERYFTKEVCGLSQDWDVKYGSSVWMNPPYGREISHWIEKAYIESKKGNTVVCLIPARMDTKYMHEIVLRGASYIGFVKGRLKFGGKGSAPFPSLVVVFEKIGRVGIDPLELPNEAGGKEIFWKGLNGGFSEQ